MTLIPPDDRVLLRLHDPETHTAFGLELPEQAREAPLRAVVLAVGRGTPTPGDPDAWIPLGVYRWNHARLAELAPGDEVILPRVGGTEIEAEDGTTVISILASSILAVVS